jgi:LuxR family transcriptional regulator, positive regulator of biofilm formation
VLQNEFLAPYFRRETGIDCSVIHTFDTIAEQAERFGEDTPLILYDCAGMDASTAPDFLDGCLAGVPSHWIVVLYNLQHDTGVEEAGLVSGVRGFFYEGDPWAHVAKGIRAVFDGELWVSRRIMFKCVSANRTVAARRPERLLSEREREIVTLLAEGAGNEEIARTVRISKHTVKNHLYRIYKKINAQGRVQAAEWAATNSVRAESNHEGASGAEPTTGLRPEDRTE